MKASKLLSVIAVAGLAVAFVSGTSVADPAKETPKQTDDHKNHDHDKNKDASGHASDKDKKDKKDEKKATKIYPGATAPDFALKDTDDKEHKLADSLKEGKIVVLQWFNAECPFVKMHYGATKTFNDLNEKYKAKGVQFFAISSNAEGSQGSGQKFNAKAKKDWSIEYPILLDTKGTVGHAYNAKNTPLMIVIGKDGKVAYMGAPDDATGTEPGKTNYVAAALDELIAGKPVTTAETKPYGCAVKYGSSNKN
jgi:peroxiredoxin